MIKKYKIMTNRLLIQLADIERQQSERLASLKKYDKVMLKEKKAGSGRAYYTSYKPKSTKAQTKYKYRYAGSDRSETVLRIKETHYLRKSLSVLGKDIKLLKKVSNKLEEIETSHINELLPAVYRTNNIQQAMSPNRIAAEWKRQKEAYKASLPVYRPEELKVPTDDGKFVRSKSEALIYNFLLKLGVTFVYELPLRTSVRSFYPDFTLLSEVDYKSVILIEHPGMMNSRDYSERFNVKVYAYLQAGYVSGVNIFYTFDSADGALNLNPVSDIVRLKIRPAA